MDRCFETKVVLVALLSPRVFATLFSFQQLVIQFILSSTTYLPPDCICGIATLNHRYILSDLSFNVTRHCLECR